MAAIQHAGARKLLDIIASAVKNDQLPSYKTAAKLLGRFPPEKHSRAVAQMCDLLDAAAALAGVPLLALVRVRNGKGKINPKAWKKSLKHRNAILERSMSHRFTAADCHHIIALAKDGSDRMTNVIGLCPNDHREAHFGERGKELEKEMILRLSAIKRTSGPRI